MWPGAAGTRIGPAAPANNHHISAPPPLFVRPGRFIIVISELGAAPQRSVARGNERPIDSRGAVELLKQTQVKKGETRAGSRQQSRLGRARFGRVGANRLARVCLQLLAGATARPSFVRAPREVAQWRPR